MNNSQKKINRWSYQWGRFRNEDKEIFLDWIYPTKLEYYRGRLVLDAGCGNGGYTKIVAKYAKHVIGLDKYAIDIARNEVKRCKNIEIVEGNIETYNPDKKFDAIYSVGVLHHLNHPEKGFKNLVKNLKSGGFINIWVYAEEGNWLMIHLIEPIKKIILLKIPLPLLRFLANLLTLTLYFFAWSIFFLPFPFPYKKYFRKFRRHTYERNLMNVFDKLNAPQTHWISRKEINKWFLGFDDVIIRHYNNISWSGFGIKPKGGNR